MTNAIEADGICKDYDGNQAVKSLSLSINNEIYGLLGPNGSGKTTTVNVLTTMLRQTAGEAAICGFDIRTQQRAIRECMSYVPQYIAADIKLTGRENVNLFAELYGIRDKGERRKKVENCLEIMGLLDRADDLTKTYSGGMHRRLELAQALVHDPQVLFLDEPTVGLDVSGRRSIWEHIVKLKRSGMTIFVTTHQMEEAERYCDRVGIIKKGTLVRKGRPSELTSSVNYVITIKSDGEVPDGLRNKVSVVKEEGDEITLRTDESMDLGHIMSEYEKEGRKVFSSSIRKATLEDIYLMSIDEGTEDVGAFNRGQYNNMLRRR